MSEGAPPAAALRVAVAVLARSPRTAGKTRLTAGRSDADAHALRLALCLDALESVHAPGWPVRVFLDPYADADWFRARLADDDALRTWAPRLSVEPQATADDLGVRMTDAMARTLAAGADVVVLVGSDVPDLPAQTLHDAATAAAADSRPLVLGPASDGGFYLAASRVADGRVFEDVVWSRDTVCADVTARAQAAGREVRLVTPWSDVDTPDDLARLVARGGAGAPRTRAIAGDRALYNRVG